MSTATKSQVDGDIELLLDYLADGPKVLPNMGTLADVLGITPGRCNSALHKVRDRDWIEEYGWTIPPVAKGIGPKVWFIFDTTEDPDDANEKGSHVFRAVNRLALPGIFTLLDRALAALQAVNEATDQRTRLGKKIKHRTDAVALSVNFLLEVLDEERTEIEAEIQAFLAEQAKT